MGDRYPPPPPPGFRPAGGTTIGGPRIKKWPDVLSLERCSFRIPYEEMNIRFRHNQKQLERAVFWTQKAGNSMLKKVKNSNEPIPEEVLRKNLDMMIQQVQNARETLQNSSKSVRDYTNKIITRCDYLVNGFELEEDPDTNVKDREHIRYERNERFLAWHLLRSGMLDIGKELVIDSKMEALVDVEVFESIFGVEKALRERNTAPCLEWCAFHRSKLRRLGSRMEIVARQQDVVTFIEQENIVDAVAYVKKNVAPIAKERFTNDLTRMMGAIAAPLAVSRQRNPHYHAANRYEQCAAMFIREAYRLYGVGKSSAVEKLVTLGLASKKTNSCKPNTETPLAHLKCAVCRPELYPLAASLPNAHIDNSRILCSLTRTVCNDDNNRPYMFPSGHVFGQIAVNRLKRLDNKIYDPVHKMLIDEEEALRLYFL